MKKFLIILGLASMMAVHAEDKDKIIGQSSLCCIYRHQIKTVDLDGKPAVDSTLAVLEIGDLVAKYGDYTSYLGYIPKDFSVSCQPGDPYQSEAVTIYQGYPTTSSLTVKEGLLPHFYFYEEENALPWTLLEEEDSVLGYLCNRAKTEYGGRKWIVSYSVDIPVSNGPWKLNGLPGLILKAESEDGVHRFIPLAIFPVEAQNISYSQDKTDVVVKRDKFVVLRNRLKTDKRWLKNAAYYLTGTDIKSVYAIPENNDRGLSPSLNINGIALPLSGSYGKQFQPLELE